MLPQDRQIQNLESFWNFPVSVSTLFIYIFQKFENNETLWDYWPINNIFVKLYIKFIIFGNNLLHNLKAQRSVIQEIPQWIISWLSWRDRES